jgi:hypothetical protein
MLPVAYWADTPLGFGKVGPHCSAKMHGNAGLSIHVTHDDGHTPIEKWNATFGFFFVRLEQPGCLADLSVVGAWERRSRGSTGVDIPSESVKVRPGVQLGRRWGVPNEPERLLSAQRDGSVSHWHCPSRI